MNEQDKCLRPAPIGRLQDLEQQVVALTQVVEGLIKTVQGMNEGITVIEKHFYTQENSNGLAKKSQNTP